jgi:hypothetical protein
MVGAAVVGAGEVGMVGVAGKLLETAGGMGSDVSVIPTMYVSYGSLEESKGSDSPSGISPLVLAYAQSLGQCIPIFKGETLQKFDKTVQSDRHHCVWLAG